MHSPDFGKAREIGALGVVFGDISGTFSLVSQGIALGFFPPLLIKHTRHRQAGHVYLPFINWLLFAGSVLLVVGFGSSAVLGSAYGLAVSPS